MLTLRLAALIVLASACAQAPSPPALEAPPWARFQDARPVTIVGYDGDAMEPFLARDGAVLFFNNRNDPDEQTDLHWAERIDDLTFRYRGEVEGANSAALDGVATVSANGRFCFVSPRAYEQTLATIYCGAWEDGRVSAPALQNDVSVHIRGRVVFDVEIDAAGDMLVVADGVFRGGPMPTSADLRLARWRDSAFHLTPQDDALFASVNSDALEYAASLSADSHMLAFTRAEGRPPFMRTSVWIATRGADNEAFGAPVRVEAIEGAAVEGPTFSPDGSALYYHRRVGDRMSIWRVSR